MLDRTGLENPLFDGFAMTSDKRYIYVCNMLTNVSHWSRNAVDFFGLPDEYMYDAGSIWMEHVHPMDRDAYYHDIDDVFSGKKDVHTLEYRAKTKEGKYVVITCGGRVIEDENGVKLFVGTMDNHGILDSVDPITNLYNSYEIPHYLQKTLEKYDQIMTLVIGINSFYEINNADGYEFGNQVLATFAQILVDEIKAVGTVFRMDGTKFLCCFPNFYPNQVRGFYAKLVHIVHNGLSIGDKKLSFGLSAGALLYNKNYDENTLRTSLAFAIQKSKRELQGELVFFEDELVEKTTKNVEFMAAIRKSVLEGYKGFYLVYQPVVDARSEQLIGAEALLRWKDDVYGEVPPGTFIPWLENDSCFFELGNWILLRALMDSKSILKKYPDFVININLAYPQLVHHNFRSCLRAILELSEFPPDHVCLELTERCRLVEKKELLSIVEFIRSLGVKVALDDFGTGFSSLNLLSDLQVDTLKIDRGFVKDIEVNSANQAIVKAVTGCADDLNIHVCVEGLEDRQMINFIKRYEVYSYQGFYFSKPIKLEDFREKYCL